MVKIEIENTHEDHLLFGQYDIFTITYLLGSFLSLICCGYFGWYYCKNVIKSRNKNLNKQKQKKKE